MELILFYIFIYIIEAHILWNYCSNILYTKGTFLKRALFFAAGYTLLFFISFTDNFWINTISFLAINFILIISQFEAKILSAFFHACATTIIMCLTELLVISLNSQLAPQIYSGRLSTSSIMIMAVFSKLLYFIATCILVIMFKNKKEKAAPNDSSTVILILIPFLSTFIHLTYIYMCLNMHLSVIISNLITASSIILLIINLLIIWIYNRSRQRSEEFYDLQLQLQKDNNLTELYKLQLSRDEAQKIFIHDIRKHLHSIKTLVNKHNYSEAYDYIEQLINSDELQSSYRYCDNDMVNSIIRRYEQKCIDNSIAMHIDIRKGLLNNLSNQDITSIFCNLLDNALEAATEDTVTDAHIDLTVTKNENTPFIVISLINSCSSRRFNKLDSILSTHKADKQHHGYGMKSIERTIQKYDGNMKCYYDDKTSSFHTIVIIR